MTKDESERLMRLCVEPLGEHFEAVQVHVTWVEDGHTFTRHYGSGNINSRVEISRRFVTYNDALDAEDGRLYLHKG